MELRPAGPQPWASDRLASATPNDIRWSASTTTYRRCPLALLTPAALRQRFADSRPWTPEFQGDARLFALEREPIAASVLMPLVERDDGLHVLLDAAHRSSD